MQPSEAAAVVRRLNAAGTVFESCCFWTATKTPFFPQPAELMALDPNTWDADLVPNFTILPAHHPDADFVDEVRRRYHGDPEYKAAITDAAWALKQLADEEITREWGVDC